MLDWDKDTLGQCVNEVVDLFGATTSEALAAARIHDNLRRVGSRYMVENSEETSGEGLVKETARHITGDLLSQEQYATALLVEDHIETLDESQTHRLTARLSHILESHQLRNTLPMDSPNGSMHYRLPPAIKLIPKTILAETYRRFADTEEMDEGWTGGAVNILHEYRKRAADEDVDHEAVSLHIPLIGYHGPIKDVPAEEIENVASNLEQSWSSDSELAEELAPADTTADPHVLLAKYRKRIKDIDGTHQDDVTQMIVKQLTNRTTSDKIARLSSSDSKLRQRQLALREAARNWLYSDATVENAIRIAREDLDGELASPGSTGSQLYLTDDARAALTYPIKKRRSALEDRQEYVKDTLHELDIDALLRPDPRRTDRIYQ